VGAGKQRRAPSRSPSAPPGKTKSVPPLEKGEPRITGITRLSLQTAVAVAVAGLAIFACIAWSPAVSIAEAEQAEAEAEHRRTGLGLAANASDVECDAAEAQLLPHAKASMALLLEAEATAAHMSAALAAGGGDALCRWPLPYEVFRGVYRSGASKLIDEARYLQFMKSGDRVTVRTGLQQATGGQWANVLLYGQTAVISAVWHSQTYFKLKREADNKDLGDFFVPADLQPADLQPADFLFGPTLLHVAAALGPHLAAEKLTAVVAVGSGAATTADRDGQLPLHVAASAEAFCQGNGAKKVCRDSEAETPETGGGWFSTVPKTTVPKRAAVVAAVLAAHPKATATKDAAGKLPLHLAISAQHDAASIVVLLAAHPGAATTVDGAGKLPLHLAITAKYDAATITVLLAAHPGAASTADGAGKLPRHLAITAKYDAAIITVLLAAHPGAATTADGAGKLPLQLAMEAGNKGAMDAIARQ
jgi:hypothetical protein